MKSFCRSLSIAKKSSGAEGVAEKVASQAFETDGRKNRAKTGHKIKEKYNAKCIIM